MRNISSTITYYGILKTFIPFSFTLYLLMHSILAEKKCRKYGRNIFCKYFSIIHILGNTKELLHMGKFLFHFLMITKTKKKNSSFILHRCKLYLLCVIFSHFSNIGLSSYKSVPSEIPQEII